MEQEKRVLIRRVDPDGTETEGTARVIRDDISQEVLRLEDYRDRDGAPLGEIPGSRFVFTMSTGENPELGSTLDELLDRLEDEQGEVDPRVEREARRLFE